jgi:katanin p60 ATPase-containing subunit A1
LKFWAENQNMTQRMSATEPPHIEDVLEKYSELTGLTMMALGSSYWGPPQEALNRLIPDLSLREVQRYGNITGDEQLRAKINQQLSSRGLDMTGLDVTVTAGANQGFLDVAMSTCDGGCDKAILIAPYYFSHKLTLQLSGVEVAVCPFDRTTLYPDWAQLEHMIHTLQPKLVVMTSPSNPGGLVWTADHIGRLVALCKAVGCWLAVDQTYYEFMFDAATHTFPCAKKFNYDRIIHIFSFSKSFGIPGWRVGYLVHPVELTPHFRKIQDCIPTHASIASQKLAIRCMEVDQECGAGDPDGRTWVQHTIRTLETVRDALWPVVGPMGTVRTTGAFYFLVPVPLGVTDDEAVDILARRHGVLLMPGWPFGAPQHLRLSYGGLSPEVALKTVDQLRSGFRELTELASSRAAGQG